MTSFNPETLAPTLVGGMSIEAFDREVREKMVMKFAASLKPEQVDQICNLPSIESLLNSGAIPIANIDVFDHGHLIRLADMHRKSGKSMVAVIADSIRRGSTIRVREIEKFDERLNSFVAGVQRRFAARSQINVYLTPPERAGFPPHFDITDIFVVQCLGKKAWKIYHDYSNKIELPTIETIWDPDRFKPLGAPEAILLEPGDVLYMPRGVMHQAACEDRESLHLTISVVPLTFADLIAKALKSAAERDLDFRRRVPWSMDGLVDEEAEVNAQTKRLIERMAHSMDVDPLFDAERRAYRPGIETNSSGELEQAVRSLRAK